MHFPLRWQRVYWDNLMMHWHNSPTHYGLLNITVHWLVAVVVFGMFGLGLWMVELDYYSRWYKAAPDLHRSIGLCLLVLMLLRLGWRQWNPPPLPLVSHPVWMQRVSKTVHLTLYAGMFALMLSGYLISTADGHGIEVFGWFEVPASLTSIPDQEDVAGEVHAWLAWSVVILACLHAGAALKHHYIDRDATLTRMLGRSEH